MRWHYAILAALAPACEATATPAVLMACPGATDVTKCLTSAQYDAIVTAVRGQLESLSATCTASDCPQADWAGCVLRMAGHDFMDFANGQGGSDACTDMEDPENAGLPECLASGEHGKSLQEVYNQYCLDVSLADFLVIAAEAVIASTRARHEDASPGAPHLDLRAAFKFGRQTASSCDFAVGRLPNPERGCEAVDETFVQRMGLDWTQAAALMGVHTLGRAKEQHGHSLSWALRGSQFRISRLVERSRELPAVQQQLLHFLGGQGLDSGTSDLGKCQQEPMGAQRHWQRYQRGWPRDDVKH